MNWTDFNDARPQETPAEAPTWSKATYTREEVLSALTARLEGVLGYLYPNGFADPKGKSFFIGDVTGNAGQSLNIVLTGERAGLWHDFATGDGGDIFDLWRAARGLKNFSDVLQDAGDFAGASSNVPRRPPKRKSPSGGEHWGSPAQTYNYTDPNGSIVAQVDRFEWIDSGRRKKAFRPWDAVAHKYQAPAVRPLYNLPAVVREPEIIVVEGEKCADALISLGIPATTAMGGSNAPAEATDWTPLRGRKVLIWPDNDETGKKYAEVVRETALKAGALSALVLRPPVGRPVKWDAADAVADGEDVRGLIRSMMRDTADAERDGTPIVAPFRSWQVIDPAQIPPREFLYGNHYIRKFASVTVAPGGLGKSTLVLAECIALATGRPILGIKPHSLCKVIYFNAEDPLDEIQRRVTAICVHYGIPQPELVGQLFIASGRDQSLILSKGDTGEIVEPVFEMIERYCEAEAIDVVAFDPLANMTDAPETNDAFRRLGRRVSLMSDRLNISVELVHHTRKLNGNEAQVEDSRGGSALIGAVRAGRALNQMSKDEAAKAGLETHIDHFRIEAAGKNNLSRSAPHATWYRRLGVQLANGDDVGVIEQWQWPDAFEGITAKEAAICQGAVMGCEEPPRADSQARDWVGHIIAEALGMDTDKKSDAARIKAIIKHWIDTDVLRIERTHKTRDGRFPPVVVVGENRMWEV